MSHPTTLADPTLWAAGLAGLADFPDERLNSRFADLLLTFARQPLDSIPQACGSARQAKATYRFLSNRRLSVADVLRPIVAGTVEGCRGQATVYAVQDTTSLNYSTLRHTRGLGALNDSPRARGLHLHTTLALRPDGVPIGLLHQHYWSRPAADPGAPDAKSLPIEDKESFKWLRGITAAEAAVAALPGARRRRLPAGRGAGADPHQGRRGRHPRSARAPQRWPPRGGHPVGPEPVGRRSHRPGA